MIIAQTQSSPVLTSATATPSRFKIKASAKAFKILSGFYSEPVLAIPRELGANAWDSHVKAKNTATPFEVHAPNTLEPWFSVRDFGTGLSPEHIETIYTTYFESTKTADNDSDGCMGLGSKTPFNYTDNFNVTSWVDGVKHVYNCYIDETGSPNILHIITEQSSDPNGLEVKFGVKIAEISMWIDKITRAYEPFRHRPKIVGANIEFAPRVYLYEGKNWGYRNTQGYYTNRSCNAFMGNYCYPVSHQAMRSAIYAASANGIRGVENVFSYGGFDFFFDIGDIEVAPNKEQLQYEDGNSTAEKLMEAATRAIEELKAQVKQSVEVPTSRWNAMALHNKYNGYNTKYTNIKNFIGDISISYNGVTIDSPNDNVSRVHSALGLLTASSALAPFQLHQLERINGKFKRTGTYYPQADGKEIVIFYTNSDSIKKARVRHYLKTKYTSDPIPLCYVVTDMSNNSATFFAHKKYFGWDDASIVNIETLPKPPVAPRQARTATTDEIFYYPLVEFITPAKNRTPRAYKASRAEAIDSKNTYYYVDFLYYDAMWNGKNISDVMTPLLSAFVDNKLNGKETTVFGINRKNLHLMKVGTWINVADEVAKVLKKNKAKYEDEYYRATNTSDAHIYSNLYNKLCRSKRELANITRVSTRKMLEDFMQAYSDSTKLNLVSHETIMFYQTFGVESKSHAKCGFDYAKFQADIEQKYMGVFDIVSDITHGIVKIINFIDKNS